jgi:hypothetical protein
MSRPRAYLAAPFSGDPHGNLQRARRWLRWLVDREPDVAFECSWMTYADVLDDTVPEHRARALVDCEANAHGCDWIVLVGGRVTSGMQREMEAVIAGGGCVADLTSLGADPLGLIEPEILEQIGPLHWGAARWEAA